MRRPVIIAARRRTPEETGQLYGLSKRRMKQITDMVEKGLAKRSYGHLYYDGTSANRNGERARATYIAGFHDGLRSSGGEAEKKTKSRKARQTRKKRAKAKPAH